MQPRPSGRKVQPGYRARQRSRRNGLPCQGKVESEFASRNQNHRRQEAGKERTYSHGAQGWNNIFYLEFIWAQTFERVLNRNTISLI